jgi:hypothetical protein
MLYACRVLENLAIPEPQDREAARDQPSVSGLVVIALGMLAAINFNDQFVLETDEIDNVAAQQLLTAEFELAEAAVAQETPHPLLGFSRLATHPPRAICKHVLGHRILTDVALPPSP